MILYRRKKHQEIPQQRQASPFLSSILDVPTAIPIPFHKPPFPDRLNRSSPTFARHQVENTIPLVSRPRMSAPGAVGACLGTNSTQEPGETSASERISGGTLPQNMDSGLRVASDVKTQVHSESRPRLTTTTQSAHIFRSLLNDIVGDYRYHSGDVYNIHYTSTHLN